MDPSVQTGQGNQVVLLTVNTVMKGEGENVIIGHNSLCKRCHGPWQEKGEKLLTWLRLTSGYWGNPEFPNRYTRMKKLFTAAKWDWTGHPVNDGFYYFKMYAKTFNFQNPPAVVMILTGILTDHWSNAQLSVMGLDSCGDGTHWLFNWYQATIECMYCFCMYRYLVRFKYPI